MEKQYTNLYFLQDIVDKYPNFKKAQDIKYKNIDIKVPAFNLLGNIIKNTTKYTKIKDLVYMLINKTSAITSEIIIFAQRDRGGRSRRNNHGRRYNSLRGGASSSNN